MGAVWERQAERRQKSIFSIITILIPVFQGQINRSAPGSNLGPGISVNAMQGTSSQQKRCDDVPLLFGILRQIRQLGWERWRIFQESSITRQTRTPRQAQKREASPDLPKFDASPFPRTIQLLCITKNFFEGTDT